MKRKTKENIVKHVALLIVAVMLFALAPGDAIKKAGEAVVSAIEAARPDYSVSPDYAARYPYGVFEFSKAEAEIGEGGIAKFKLIREGGTKGAVTVELKAIDVTAKYGVDYYVAANGYKLLLDDEYSGTLTENYLEENGFDYVTSDALTTDPVYKAIIGYRDTTLDDDETAELYGASVGLVADTLNISEEKAQQLLGVTMPTDEETYEDFDDAQKAYKSKLHEQHDAVLGTKTAANYMADTDLIDEDTVYGSNEENLAASKVYGAAVGASLKVTFKDGENEKDLTVVTLNDKIYEPQEIVSLGICNPTGGAEIGALMNVAIKINDDDPIEKSAIGFETATVKVGSDENAAAIDIVRSGCLNDYAVVKVSTKSVTAKEGSDYLPINTTSVFLPGEARKTVIVPLKTSVCDQTEQKTVEVNLSCDTAGVTTTAKSASVYIEPRPANGEAVARLSDEGNVQVHQQDDQIYIVVPQEIIDGWKAASSDGLVRLYYPVQDSGDYFFHEISHIEIDLKYTGNTITDYGGESGRVRDSLTLTTMLYTEDVFNKKGSFDVSSSKLDIKEEATSESFRFTEVAEGTITANVNYARDVSLINNNADNALKIARPGVKNYYMISWNSIEIKEIRMYISTHSVYANHTYDKKNDEQHRTSSVKGTYRVFDGTDDGNIVDTKEYDAGTVVVDPIVYRNYIVGLEKTNLTEEAQKRKLSHWSTTYELVDNAHLDNRFNAVNDVRAGSQFSIANIQTLMNPHNFIMSMLHIEATPTMQGMPVDFITIGDYDKTMGNVKIGGKEYCNENVTSESWREGDELKFIVEIMHGYKCDVVEITRADGTVEKIAPGDIVMMTKGMSIKPVLYQENVTATVNWSALLPGKDVETKEANLAHNYVITSTTAFEYAKDENGNDIKDTIIFKDLAHGDAVNLYAVPATDADGTVLAEDKCTALWLREKLTDADKSLSDDTRFFICLGDGYTFTVDDHDMVIDYYFVVERQDESGGVVSGRVFSPGGTVKNHNDAVITAENAEQAGKPVANASVSILSLDPFAKYNDKGKIYYTETVTDQDGRFSLYVPSGQKGYGYCVTIVDNDRVYHYITAFATEGTTIYILPFQSAEYQVTDMTLGQDQETTEVPVGEDEVVFGVKILVASGYRAQGLIFRSYDDKGMLLHQWDAVTGESGWDYQTRIKTGDYLVPGGRLTVEIIDADGQGRGEVDSGYRMRIVPVSSQFTLPSFDPNQSVSLPVFGEYTTSFNLGSASNVEPEKVDADTGTLSGGDQSVDQYSICYGAGKALKEALKKAKEDAGYASMSARERASLILSKISVSEDDMKDIKDFKSEQRAGKGKSSLGFQYQLGVYMLMHTDGGSYYFDDLILYATISAKSESTQQFTIAGVPVYVKFAGQLSGSIMVHVDNASDGALLMKITNDDGSVNGYFNDDMLSQLRTSGAFNVTVSVTLGLGVGNPKYLSAGLAGTITMNMDFQPWSDGAGIVDLSLDLELKIVAFSLKYNIAKTSYGMFRTENYDGALDFSNVANKEKFVTDGKRLLLSYDDGKSLTQVFGEMKINRRGGSVMNAQSMALDETEDRIIAAKSLNDVAGDTNPILMPVMGGASVLYLRLSDDTDRGDNDYSSVVYSVIDYNGVESAPKYLDNDGTFDSKLTAAEIGDGRILVVWRNHTKTYGNGEVDLGDVLNHTDLCYCIFSAEGVPGEVRKLTDVDGAAGLPTIAYDEQTGKTVVVYSSTDYKTEGVTFSSDNMEDLGNFLYNSYSTICFKVLDSNGNIITDYTAAESNYSAYESENGTLGGMRYLNTQLNNAVSQAAIDEIDAEARNGKLYVVYSLDTDSSIHTNEDRELFATIVDLTTMQQSAPERLTSNGVVDSNPQIVEYENDVQLYWNHGGKITLANLEKFFAYRAENQDESYVNDIAREIEDAANAATSFHVRVLNNGKLIIVWSGWNDVDGERRVAVCYKEYDPEYTVRYTDDDGNVSSNTYGAWGNPMALVTLDANQDCTEFAFIYSGMRAVIAYKATNVDENNNIHSHDAHVRVLRKLTSVDTFVDINVKYLLPGQKAAMKVTAVNTGSLPSESVTLQAYLVDKDGNRSLIGEQTFDGHYQSNGIVSEVFNDFTMPEDIENGRILVLAWEKDVEEFPFEKYFDLPYSSAVRIDDFSLTRKGEGYVVAFNVVNDGNKAFDGVVTLDYVAEDLKLFDDSETFTPVMDDVPVSVGAKSTARKVIYFNVDEDRLSEYDDSCKIYLAVENGEEKTLDSKSFFVRKYYSALPTVNDVLFDGEKEVPSISLTEGGAASLNALITPYKARNGYHLEYSIDDESVAVVDEFGTVTALKGGTANVTVSVVKDPVAMVIGTDGRASTFAGTAVITDEYGRVALTASEQETVMTKTVAVSVTAVDTSSDPTDSTQNASANESNYSDNSCNSSGCTGVMKLPVLGLIVVSLLSCCIILRKKEN